MNLQCSRRDIEAGHPPLEERPHKPSPDQALSQVAATEGESAHEDEAAAEPQRTQGVEVSDPLQSGSSSAQEAEAQPQISTQENPCKAISQAEGKLILVLSITQRDSLLISVWLLFFLWRAIITESSRGPSIWPQASNLVLAPK